MSTRVTSPTPAAAAEAKLLEAVKDLPPARLRRLLDELVKLTAEPRCAEAQADGVPCPTAHNSCEQCAQFAEVLNRVRERLEDE